MSWDELKTWLKENYWIVLLVVIVLMFVLSIYFIRRD